MADFTPFTLIFEIGTSLHSVKHCSNFFFKKLVEFFGVNICIDGIFDPMFSFIFQFFLFFFLFLFLFVFHFFFLLLFFYLLHLFVANKHLSLLQWLLVLSLENVNFTYKIMINANMLCAYPCRIEDRLYPTEALDSLRLQFY
jgi:hypothetical protein